jgi:multidrug efflux system membrane fusion protein
MTTSVITQNEMRAARARRAVGSALLLLSIVATAAGCSKSDAAKGGPGGPGGRPVEFPVEVQPVASRQVEYAVTAVGSVEAFERVEVTARVAGVVDRVRFVEGSYVQPATVLVEIEPERYRLAVAASEATLEKQMAAKAEAEAGLARREAAQAKNPGLIRGEEVETWRTRARSAAAEVMLARVALDQAKLNLRDAFVRAPVGGTIQTRTVQTGQYVQPGGVLATLVRRDPLLLRFQIPEQESLRIKPGMTARFSVNEGAATMNAKITHVAESANSTSRMVQVTANVVDPGRAELKPGAFARVVIPVGGNVAAPVIPQTAIRPSERGFLAFVVNGGKAEERLLTLGMRTSEGQVEVRTGLKPGEQLVIRGAEALRDGVDVKVESK